MFIPKKIFAEFNKHSKIISFPGFWIGSRRIKNIAQVNIDWQNMINGTELKAKTVNTILLKITIIKELLMYNKIEGQCIFIFIIL